MPVIPPNWWRVIKLYRFSNWNIFSAELTLRMVKSSDQPSRLTTKGNRLLISGEGMLTSPPADPGVRTHCQSSSPPQRAWRRYWQPCLLIGKHSVYKLRFSDDYRSINLLHKQNGNLHLNFVFCSNQYEIVRL